MVPRGVDDDYCRQIVSEARIKTPNGKPEWIARSKHNHFLDCEAMQAAVSYMLNAQRTIIPRSVADKPEDARWWRQRSWSRHPRGRKRECAGSCARVSWELATVSTHIWTQDDTDWCCASDIGRS
jgi:hypothetical protein